MGLRGGNGEMRLKMAVPADHAALLQVKPGGFSLRQPAPAADAVLKPRLEAFTGGQMEQESGDQGLPGLVGEGQAGQGVQQQHEQLLGRHARLNAAFRHAQQVGTHGETVEVLAQGVEGFDQVGETN